MPRDALPVLPFPSAQAWEAWLDAHHADSPGLWLRIAKKGNPQPSVSYAEAVEAALCYGWIDGQKATDDEPGYFLQRFTPRRPRSRWSQVNRAKVDQLTAQGRMRPAGLREVEAARADGRWEAAYAPPSTMTVPDDLAAALAAQPAAAAAFATLDAANRYAVLFRVQDAKRPETRARRIATFVALLAEGGRLHP